MASQEFIEQMEGLTLKMKSESDKIQMQSEPVSDNDSEEYDETTTTFKRKNEPSVKIAPVSNRVTRVIPSRIKPSISNDGKLRLWIEMKVTSYASSLTCSAMKDRIRGRISEETFLSIIAKIKKRENIILNQCDDLINTNFDEIMKGRVSSELQGKIMKLILLIRNKYSETYDRMINRQFHYMFPGGNLN